MKAAASEAPDDLLPSGAAPSAKSAASGSSAPLKTTKKVKPPKAEPPKQVAALDDLLPPGTEDLLPPGETPGARDKKAPEPPSKGAAAAPSAKSDAPPAKAASAAAASDDLLPPGAATAKSTSAKADLDLLPPGADLLPPGAAAPSKPAAELPPGVELPPGAEASPAKSPVELPPGADKEAASGDGTAEGAEPEQKALPQDVEGLEEQEEPERFEILAPDGTRVELIKPRRYVGEGENRVALREWTPEQKERRRTLASAIAFGVCSFLLVLFIGVLLSFIRG